MVMPSNKKPDSAWLVLLIFFRLGLSSFGGPVAHLGYFRREFVEHRGWLDEHHYAELVALCQFLPGATSSQVGMAVGLARAGWPGLLAAWAGFTLPSAALLILFALGIAHYPVLANAGWVHGLKVVAVAVVAHAVWAMAKFLCPDRLRIGLAILTALLSLTLPSAATQLIALSVSALIGRVCLTITTLPVGQLESYSVSPRTGTAALLCLALLLLTLPLLSAISGSPTLALLDGVFRAGALVFGGGHVVLPLLQSSTHSVGISGAEFLAGYGAAQAVPGPLFSIAAYLGAIADWPLQGWLGGLVLTGVIFTPAVLLLVGVLPFWQALRQRPGVQAAVAGINAGVVGILLSALYDPLWKSAVQTPWDVALAFLCVGLLGLRTRPILVVALAAVVGQLLQTK